MSDNKTPTETLEVDLINLARKSERLNVDAIHVCMIYRDENGAQICGALLRILEVPRSKIMLAVKEFVDADVAAMF